jgi:hypothetical protein
LAPRGECDVGSADSGLQDLSAREGGDDWPPWPVGGNRRAK